MAKGTHGASIEAETATGVWTAFTSPQDFDFPYGEFNTVDITNHDSDNTQEFIKGLRQAPTVEFSVPADSSDAAFTLADSKYEADAQDSTDRIKLRFKTTAGSVLLTAWFLVINKQRTAPVEGEDRITFTFQQTGAAL